MLNFYFCDACGTLYMTNAHKCVVCGAESARKRVYTKDEVIIEDAPPLLPEEHFYRGKQWLPASA